MELQRVQANNKLLPVRSQICSQPQPIIHLPLRIQGLNPHMDPFHSHSPRLSPLLHSSNLQFRCRFHQTHQVSCSDPSLPSLSLSRQAESRRTSRIIYYNGMQRTQRESMPARVHGHSQKTGAADKVLSRRRVCSYYLDFIREVCCCSPSPVTDFWSEGQREKMPLHTASVTCKPISSGRALMNKIWLSYSATNAQINYSVRSQCASGSSGLIVAATQRQTG